MTAIEKVIPLDAVLQQAVAHHQAGRLLDAERLYRAILQVRPDQPDANHNLGVLAGQVGQHAAGLPYLKKALDVNPFQGQYVLSYANALLTTGQMIEALDVLHAAGKRGFDNPAVQALRQKIEAAKPGGNAKSIVPPAEIDRLAALFDAGQHAGLERHARLLLERYPDSGAVWKILGVSLYMQGSEALPALRKATELLPDDAEAHSNLGNVLHAIGQLDGAVASHVRALEIRPDYAEAHSNLGNALQDLRQLDNAAASFRRALEIKPDLAEAHFNLGLCLLEMGRYAEGWREYGQRLKAGKLSPSRHATLLPQWDGRRPFSGDRLLIFEEQGLGDRLQFARFLPQAAERFAGGVSLVTDRSLLALFRRSFPGVEILEAVPADQSAWQWQCPLLCLPLIFETVLETIPRRIPYLIPDPVRAACRRDKIAELGLPASTRKIGLVWKTGSTMKDAAMRSLALQQLAPLLNLPGCAWFSLQKEPDQDKALWVTSGKLIDWSGEFRDFAETAALAINMDLVITVDTATAHLAGGLGLPTWLLNRHASEWRWMLDREDSPWYPTMRIFTQKKAGEWDEVVRRMADALSTDTNAAHSNPPDRGIQDDCNLT